MPTYQYACTACGERLEAVQKFTDEALTECPVCGGRLRKVFSAAGIIFKGSGFYRNDSRGSGKSSSSVSASGSSGDTKSEASSASDSGSGSSASSSSSSSSSSSESTSSAGSSSGSSEKVA